MPVAGWHMELSPGAISFVSLCECRALHRLLPSASLPGCLCKWLENVFCRRLCPCSSPLGRREGHRSQCWSRCLAPRSILSAASPSRSKGHLSCKHVTRSGDVIAQSRAGGGLPHFPSLSLSKENPLPKAAKRPGWDEVSGVWVVLGICGYVMSPLQSCHLFGVCPASPSSSVIPGRVTVC